MATADNTRTPVIIASYDPNSAGGPKASSKDLPMERGLVRYDDTADTRPCFSSAWVEDSSSEGFGLLRSYDVSGVPVRLWARGDSGLGLYAIHPPEYKLNPRHIRALAEAMAEIVSRMPGDIELASLEIVRPYIKAKAKDLLYSRLVAQQDGSVDSHEVDIEADRLSEILSKYTAGYGILETLLEDDLVQDIFVDSPSSHAPVQVVLRSEAHQSVRQKCRTNVFLGRRDLKAIVSRVKLETGLPFSEANPVLEADLRRLDCRITIVGPPLSERGVAIAIRKHARNIWTMPSLIANDTLSPLLSAFLWACAIGRRTVLIAGSRGSGKTTLLGALMLEFPLTQRVVVIEDTPEIPTRRMQELGFDIQPLRFSQGGSRQNISADDALRVSLRMGESAIVVGEVRGQEARLLYESMRAGSAGSAVLGTIHGNSARGVLDRAIEDLGISERAFSSTDLIVVMGLLRAPDGSRFQRRISEVAEVRYEKSGISIAGLFSMENGSSCASPTSIFSDGCQTMKNIGQSLGCGSERMMAIVKARAHADQLYSELVNRQSSSRSPEEMRLRSNEVLTGLLFSSDDPETGLRRWREWFDAENGKVNSE